MRAPNFILVDASKLEGGLNKAREIEVRNTCLFEGESEKFLGTVAPWLFACSNNKLLENWMTKVSKQEDWGIMFVSDAQPISIYKHLRNFLVRQDQHGNEVYFRFYNPSVLASFLPTCDPQQLEAFFGPIQSFLVAQADERVAEYSLEDGQLKSILSQKNIADYFKNDTVPEILQTFDTPIVPEVEESIPAAHEEPKEDSSSSSDGTWDFGY